jgi:hypothetical protein
LRADRRVAGVSAKKEGVPRGRHAQITQPFGGVGWEAALKTVLDERVVRFGGLRALEMKGGEAEMRAPCVGRTRLESEVVLRAGALGMIIAAIVGHRQAPESVSEPSLCTIRSDARLYVHQ